MRRFRLLGFLLFLPSVFLSPSVDGGVLPGFSVEKVGVAEGFGTSVVCDSTGRIYLTTSDGWIQRVDAGQAVRVAALPTRSGGNGGLLGMALLDDATAVVHYTAWGMGNLVVDDVVSRVDLASGAESVVRAFACDVEVHDRGASSEHHGGNLIVAPDGAIFLGIGEYGYYAIAQNPAWNAGKIWRIDPSGNATQWALGMRNPFDLAWDPELDRIVVTDNGPQQGDELHVIAEGANCGWPKTFGTEPPLEGAVPPVYVFPQTVAPTGILRLDGTNPLLRRGYLLGSFVASSLFYFPTAAAPVADPIPIVDAFDTAIIDVTQSPSGEIYFLTASFPNTTSVWRLVAPLRGDCNGDGVLDWHDLVSTMREIDDGMPHPMTEAQGGDYAGSWGCDANADGWIDAADLDAVRQLLSPRRRAVGTR